MHLEVVVDAKTVGHVADVSADEVAVVRDTPAENAALSHCSVQASRRGFSSVVLFPAPLGPNADPKTSPGSRHRFRWSAAR